MGKLAGKIGDLITLANRRLAASGRRDQTRDVLAFTSLGMLQDRNYYSRRQMFRFCFD
jgi:hypothetical protein